MKLVTPVAVRRRAGPNAVVLKSTPMRQIYAKVNVRSLAGSESKLVSESVVLLITPSLKELSRRVQLGFVAE